MFSMYFMKSANAFQSLEDKSVGAGHKGRKKYRGSCFMVDGKHMLQHGNAWIVIERQTAATVYLKIDKGWDNGETGAVHSFDIVTGCWTVAGRINLRYFSVFNQQGAGAA